MAKSRKDILEQRDYIERCIKDGVPKAEICRVLKCKFETLNAYLRLMDLEYRGNSGRRNIPHFERRTSAVEKMEKYKSGEIKVLQSHSLKLNLIRDGIKKHQCERCGLEKWNFEQIPLELHHVDGNRHNNTLENIQLLCPNCHAQCDNNGGASLKRKNRNRV